jgi:transposase
MSETRRKFNQDFREGAVRLVLETGKPIAQVARDLGINEGTLGNWVARERRARGEGRGVLSDDERPSWSGCAGRTPSCGCSVMC